MVDVIQIEDRGIETSSDGVTTLTQVMQIESDSIVEIASSSKIPRRGWRHSSNSGFVVDSISVSPNGNKKRRIQALVTITYNNSTELLREYTEDPWDLGAQNFKSTYIAVEAPLLSGHDANGNEIQNVNSAGCRLIAETTRYIREISFTYCVRARSTRDFDGATEEVINKDTVTVAGVKIPALTGLLMPTDAALITEYEAAGDKIKRQYWEVSATIRINERGWYRDELNVGTMAYFTNKNGEIVKTPQNIYSYHPWVSADPSVNMIVQPKFGCIADVIAAKNAYASVVSDYDPSSGESLTDQQMQKYQQAWDELPFSEVTEPVPLRPDGTIYEEALTDPVNYPYYRIRMYDKTIESWNKFDLPKNRS